MLKRRTDKNEVRQETNPIIILIVSCNISVNPQELKRISSANFPTLICLLEFSLLRQKLQFAKTLQSKSATLNVNHLKTVNKVPFEEYTNHNLKCKNCLKMCKRSKIQRTIFSRNSDKIYLVKTTHTN